MSAELYLANLALIDQVIRFVTRSCRREEAEEFGSMAHVKLIENDYEVLRAYEGRSSLRTYLFTVLHRHFLDDRTQRWGRYRSSAAAVHLGPLAVRLEELTVRDGLSLDEACEALRTNEGVTETPAALAALAAQLPPRHSGRYFEGEDAIACLSVSAESSVEAPTLAKDAEREQRAVHAALTRALERLPDQDRLILLMRFRDELGVAAIASALHLDAKPLYRRVERLLRHLRKELEAEGFGSREALGWLEWDLG